MTEILALKALPPLLKAKLDGVYTVHRYDQAPDRAAFLAEVGPRISAIAVGGSTPFPAELWDGLPNLKLIAVHGVGTDAIDHAEAKKRGVAVTITEGVLTEDVADLAIGLWLAVKRQLVVADRYVRSGDWAAGKGFPLASRASGSNVGILGLGQIGQAILDRAAPFAASLHYHSRRPVEGATAAYAETPVALAERCDVVFVIVPGGPATKGLVSAEVLAALGPKGVLVNVARGSVVDEAALIEALRNGVIAGAGLDVFEVEPTTADGLADLDNVVLLPHVGSATTEAREGMAASVMASLDRYVGQ